MTGSDPAVTRRTRSLTAPAGSGARTVQRSRQPPQRGRRDARPNRRPAAVQALTAAELDTPRAGGKVGTLPQTVRDYYAELYRAAGKDGVLALGGTCRPKRPVVIQCRSCPQLVATG
ncbi:hypothetical protein GS426_08030 [Rhodococcus hoagii]|nr:hypothetical protein [Prescottella equi]